MPNPPSKQNPAFPWLPLGLAALGQFFLAQAGQPWTLFPGLVLLVGALPLLSPSPGKTEKTKESPLLPLRWELTFFLLILLLAAIFRIYGIDSLPAGLHSDQGLTGLCALRILHEGWRPFGEVFDYQVPEILLFYQLAAWFALVGSSAFTFHLFFILLSLAAFPLAYWAIRQWAGPRTALLALFILAVMRWNWIETRNGYPSIQVPFYLFGALAFWTYWRSSGKKGPLLVSALFVGVGFYTYQAFKIVPFLMAAIAHCDYWGGKKKNRSLKPYLLYFSLVLLLVSPLLGVMAQRGILGHREADLFIGSKVLQERSLQPLWDVWTGTLLMFNRAGDLNPRHNLPGHRMLDDVTAVFFVLGLALAWRKRKERGGLYPLLGFGVMLLTGLLSTDPAHSNRLVSLTPFVACFAAYGFLYFWERAKYSLAQFPVPLIAAFLLASMGFLNFQTYFTDQAKEPACRAAFDPGAFFIGRNIADSSQAGPGQYRYFISPAYFQNHTVDFLAYSARAGLSPFNLQDWAGGKVPADKPVYLYLEREKSGVMDFLQTLYPGLAFVTYPAPRDCPEVKLAWIPKNGRASLKPWRRGLKGTYFNSSDWKGVPVTVQADPVLNFTSKFDFPFTQGPPFRIRWTGVLEVPKTGGYQFQIVTTDDTQLALDGKPVPWESSQRLAAGAHQLRLDFEKNSGESLALTLIWKKPGTDKWEVVPATAFGPAK